MATHSSVLAWRIPGRTGSLVGCRLWVAQSWTRLKRLSSSSSMCVCVCVCMQCAVLSRYVVSIYFAAPWTAACQAPLSMGFSRQEYRSGLPFPPPRDLLNARIKLTSPTLTGRFFTPETLGKPIHTHTHIFRVKFNLLFLCIM